MRSKYDESSSYFRHPAFRRRKFFDHQESRENYIAQALRGTKARRFLLPEHHHESTVPLVEEILRGQRLAASQEDHRDVRCDIKRGLNIIYNLHFLLIIL